MDETMNLNGMGVGASPTMITANNSSEIVENQETKSDNSKVVDVSSLQSAETNSSNKNSEPEKVNAGNEMDFQNLDMIKELRAEEDASRKKESIFSSMDFGPLKKYLEDDDVTDISYSNGGQLWLKTLSKGVYRVDERDINDALIEKIAFQCSNVMGKTFNMAHPFLDSESAELRMNFIHDSIARNGIAVVFRKTPAKIRLEKEKLMKENYVSLSIHDFLIKAVQGHCNIIMCGETGSGKTEFLKYLASHTFENEKIVTVEDTLELHLDRIYPHRDIVAMKTNNVASYSDVLVTCMRQNPIWILLSEVRSAEAVTAVRNSISSGHFILSTIHADKAANIPYRLYSLLESNIDVEQFLNTIYRYVQIGVFLRGRFDPKQGRFVREIGEVTEFYVNENNECITNTIYQKTIRGDVTYKPISNHLLDYLEGQGMDMRAIREANGDLEKAQEYNDELSEEPNTINNEDKEEITSNVDSTGLTTPVSLVENNAESTLSEVPVTTVPQQVSVIAEDPKVVPITEDMKPVVAPVVVEPLVQPVTEQPIITSVENNAESTALEVPITTVPQQASVVAEDPKVVPITEDMKPVVAPVVVEPLVQPVTEQPIITPVENNAESTALEVPITTVPQQASVVAEDPKVVPITEDMKPVVAPVVVEPSVQPVTEQSITTPVENNAGSTALEVPITTVPQQASVIAEDPKVVPITEDMKPVVAPVVVEPSVQPVTEQSITTPVENNAGSTVLEVPEITISHQVNGIAEELNPVIQDISALMAPAVKPQPEKPLIDTLTNQVIDSKTTTNSLFMNDNDSSGDTGNSNTNFTVPNITNIQ